MNYYYMKAPQVADTSVEMPKLHNIKLLYTHYNYYDEYFCFAACKLKEWVMIGHDSC